MRRLNLEAARICREAADEVGRATGIKRYVAGGLGPMNRTASISPLRWIAPITATSPLLRLSMPTRRRPAPSSKAVWTCSSWRTVFDTLNCKGALFAIRKLFEEEGMTEVPVLVSATITDKSGRTLSGQTVEAFYASVRHGHLFSVGLNCALGCHDMKPYMERVAAVSESWTSCYPNAGLPNAMGGYDETPESMALALKEFAANGWLNIVGGCCGTGPEHIREITKVMKGMGATPERQGSPRHDTVGPS